MNVTAYCVDITSYCHDEIFRCIFFHTIYVHMLANIE